jgi:hypothetical protein
MKVKVYWNLHKKVFSVVALEGPKKGRVVSHMARLVIALPTFKVSEAGRQRVLREQRKNVHAWVIGEWRPYAAPFSPTQEATYNPYKYASFVLKDSERPIYDASRAWLENRRIFVLDPH